MYSQYQCLQRFTACTDAVECDKSLRKSLNSFLKDSFPRSPAHSLHIEAPVSHLLTYTHELFAYYNLTTQDAYWRGRFYPYLLMGLCLQRAQKYGVLFRDFTDLQMWFADYPNVVCILENLDSSCDQSAIVFLATTVHIVVHCSYVKPISGIAQQLSKNMLLYKLGVDGARIENMNDALLTQITCNLCDAEMQICETLLTANMLIDCANM